MMRQDTAFYKDFTEEELAADEYFQQWVLLRDDESQRYWDSFIRKFPHQQVAVSNASRLVQHLTRSGFHLPFLTDTEKQDLKNSIFEKISTPAITDNGNHRFRRNLTWWLSAAAAVLVIFFAFRRSNAPPAPDTLAFVSTPIQQVKKIVLPDSSVVILNGNSSLHYGNHLGTAPVREVFLTGNAYFHVKKTAPSTPFIVHANQLKIYVTGTEFNVNARSNATGVVLTHGSINVTLEGDKRKTVYMHPGSALMVDTLNNELITTPTPTEMYTAAWNQGEWHFEQTPLIEVSRLIKAYYGMEMIFTAPEQQNRMITAVVSVNDFPTLLQVLEKTLNISIQTQNQQLIIINPQSKQL